MDIDESRGDDQTFRVDLAFSRIPKTTHLHDAIAIHGHVREEPGISGAIDYFSVADYEVELRAERVGAEQEQESSDDAGCKLRSFQTNLR